MRRAVCTVVSPFAALTACVGVAGSSSSSTSLSPSSAEQQQRRGYRWHVAHDLVPEGVKTSPFQSSNVPSERRAVLQEYAVAPLFGSRISALLVGSTVPVKEFVRYKKQLAAIMDDILGFSEPTVTLGETLWLANGAVPQVKSPAYMRLDPRTGELLASCLVAVYLPSEMDLLQQIEYGLRLSDAITGATPDPRLVKDNKVTYCEFEMPDLNECVPTELLGEAVDPDAASVVLDRWMERIQDQMALWDGESDKEEAAKRAAYRKEVEESS